MAPKQRCAFCRRRWTRKIAFFKVLKPVPICGECEQPFVVAASVKGETKNDPQAA